MLQTGLFFAGSVFLEQGQRQPMETLWREAAALGERASQANARLQGMALLALLATLAGRLEEAAAIGKRAAALGEELGLATFGRVYCAVGSGRAFIHLGRAEELLANTADVSAQTLCLAHLGQAEEARALLDKLVVRRPGIGSEQDETWLGHDCLYLEAAALLLERLGERPQPVSDWLRPTCPARHLGAAAALLGERETAHRFTAQALRDAQQVLFRPEIALTHLQLAELLAGGDRDQVEAREHLDAALPEFEAMGMPPALERARQLQERLGA